MIIVRIDNNFNDMDTAYTKLYECQDKLDKNITLDNKNELLKALAEFKQSLSKYEAAVKSLYINRKRRDNEIFN